MWLAASCQRSSPYFTAAPAGDKEHRVRRSQGERRERQRERDRERETERDRERAQVQGKHGVGRTETGDSRRVKEGRV